VYLARFNLDPIGFGKLKSLLFSEDNIGFNHWCSRPTRQLFTAKSNETSVGLSSFK